MPRAARRFAGQTAQAWSLGDPDGAISLLVSELVTNAVLHARTPLEITIGVAAGALEIAVSDHDRRLPVTRAARRDLVADLLQLEQSGGADDAEPRHPSLHVGEAGSVLAGRGLLLVDALSDEWGVCELADGKAVWARIAIPADWRYGAACPCHGGDDRLATLASGQPVTVVPGPWDEQAPATVA